MSDRNELIGDIISAFSALTNAYYMSSSKEELTVCFETFNEKFRSYMKWLDAEGIPRKDSYIVKWVRKVDVLTILTHVKWITAKRNAKQPHF